MLDCPDGDETIAFQKKIVEMLMKRKHSNGTKNKREKRN